MRMEIEETQHPNKLTAAIVANRNSPLAHHEVDSDEDEETNDHESDLNKGIYILVISLDAVY